MVGVRLAGLLAGLADSVSTGPEQAQKTMVTTMSMMMTMMPLRYY